ncbi:RHS repeat-associated core domain-containing protein [Trinickia diaoshuihuensis]|uniref:RHS repeat-associated core domain-containing protein n=1 Tax=Trinickia diaoshuihuensis TaxID=2292265 RepID=UPI001F07C2D6|nr:RHS repeat-associated core domain-containing protein [Trinickia diaoshuihuensis]
MSEPISVRFTGAYADAITAGYPLGNGYRWYLPGLMRFNAPDEDSPFDAGGPNPYAYCADDPVNHSDPTGHVSWSSLTHWLDIGTSHVGVSVRRPGLDVPIAGEHAVGASTEIVATRRLEPGPPAYRQTTEASEPPPAYEPFDWHHPSLLPSYHESVVAPISGQIKGDLAMLYRDMGEELLRLYGESRHEARIPSLFELLVALAVDRRNWRRLKVQRAEETALRADRMSEYRLRLDDIEQRIKRERALDGEAPLKNELKMKLRENKRLYRLLKA